MMEMVGRYRPRLVEYNKEDITDYLYTGRAHKVK